MPRLSPLLLALVIVALAAPAVAAGQEASVPGQIIVVFRHGVSAPQRADTRDDAGVDLERSLGSQRFQLTEVADGQTVTGALGELRRDPDVLAADRNGISATTAMPNDTDFGLEWGLRNTAAAGLGGFPGTPLAGADIDAISAWDRTVGTPATVIADIDAGYSFSHPDLGPVTWQNTREVANGIDDDGNGRKDDIRGWDFVGAEGDTTGDDNDNDPTDDDPIAGGHGVHTAGTMGAAGDNGIGITGVSQNARIMPLRACTFYTSLNRTGCPDAAVIAAINYAGANGARAANLSLGSTTANDAFLAALAANPQTLYVIAAGNDAQDNEAVHHYPCDYQPASVAGAIDNIVCVAATDQADKLAGFSDYGAQSVDLGAPGTEIWSTWSLKNAYEEQFEGSGFDGWTTSAGATGPFGRTDESPLTSFGVTDTPGAAAAPNTVRSSLSPTIAVPAGAGNCVYTQTRTLNTTGATFNYQVLKNGSPVINSTVTTSGRIHTASIPGLGGSNVQIRLTFSTGASPGAGAGAWVDNVDLRCVQNTYKYEQGTSMATPHVTGAAGLLFSLRPDASVTQVRSSLLSTVDPVASLSGKTVSGGRLNADAALADLAAKVAAPTTPVTPSTPAGAGGGATVGGGGSVSRPSSAGCE